MEILSDTALSNAIAFIALLMSLFSLLVSIASVIVSYRAAKKFGDVAGTEAAIAYQQKQAEQACVRAFKSMHLAIQRALGIAQYNSDLIDPNLGYLPPHKLPVTPFEAAFFSRDAILIDELKTKEDFELLTSIDLYLSYAYTLNSFIDRFHAQAISTMNQATLESIQKVASSEDLLSSISQLEMQLKARLSQKIFR